MRALAAIDTWGATHAAAGVLGAGGSLLGAHGATEARYALASVTKLLSTYAVLVAVEEGTVGLGDPGGPAGSTLRHLLAHASGLGPDGFGALAKPGHKRVYSNSGFEVAAALVERRAAMAFADYLREGVLEPLGMHATRLDGSPAHGATSTLADMLAFAAELQSPRLVSPSTLAEATSTQFPGLSGVVPGFGRQGLCDWGLGFELKDAKSPHWTAPSGSPGTFGHFGRAGTFCWVDPDAQVACVVLTDREFGPWAAQAWPALSGDVLAEAAAR